ncbi:anti-phage dCTP deaminase [uncultured Pseudacidovorax sp.]|uniref:anti-phage dCTP deaminase n=1 Tax=uncultured Pseudacidovorax sp. TaxID=679313 RepID=UPI0025E42B20|nr:anti-phage dCTP deaminase [uncultured Pseudacidovorax sp.]
MPTSNALKSDDLVAAINDEGGGIDEIHSTQEAVSTLTPELVIALCGPIGSPLHEAADQIVNTLQDYNYETIKIRLSQYIEINASSVGMKHLTSNSYEKIKSLIEIGDKLREDHGHDILAKLAIAKINADREKRYGKPEDRVAQGQAKQKERVANQRICHVIDSIKNKSELDLLRLIYGKSFYAIGVFSPMDIRKENLTKDGALNNEQINSLIDTDSGEEFSHGQSVRKTFPNCDLFMRIDSALSDAEKVPSQLVSKLGRFFSLLFRVKVVSPTFEESAMYSAASAARNSACLSRQVGAAVTSQNGEMLSVGWNDVPRSGGGLYGKRPLSIQIHSHDLEDKDEDHRCYRLPGAPCSNDSEKSLIVEKIANSLREEGIIPKEKLELAIKKISEDSRIKDLIEFSRAVHAEMHAILSASRVAGDRILNGNIFVTTYPCHSCARHIVAAGIRNVYFIEPYPKSLATRLHKEDVTEDVAQQSKVRLFQYDGIAPRRFIDIFEAGSRKKDGKMSLLSKREALPSSPVSMRAIPRLEEVVLVEVTHKKLELPELD